MFLSLTEAETLDTLTSWAVPPPKLFSRDPRLLATHQRPVVVLVKGQKEAKVSEVEDGKTGVLRLFAQGY